MNRQWLAERDADFHKRTFSDLFAQREFAIQNKIEDDIRWVEQKISHLKTFGKLSNSAIHAAELNTLPEITGKQAYRALCAQLVFAQRRKTGHAELIQKELARLKEERAIPDKEAVDIETDVRVETAEVQVALEEPITVEPTQPQLAPS